MKEEVLQRCKDDLLFFGKVVAPTMFTVKSAPFHRELADLYHDSAQRKSNIIAPRGHAKSSIMAGLAPLHHTIFSDEPTFVVLVSKTQTHANRLLASIKDILEYSDSFRALFGYWGQHSAKRWTLNELELKNGAYFLTRGANQQMRGLKHINQRPTFVVYDDPEDEENTRTEESRYQNLTGLLKGVVPGLDARRGRVFIIGTPIHAQGIVNTLERASDWETKKYKALNHDEAGQPYALWPEVWPIDRIMKEKEALESIGRSSAWYSEFQCEIVGDQDQLFQQADLQLWQGSLERDTLGNPYLEVTMRGNEAFEVPLKVPVNLFMGVDLASSLSRYADKSAIVVIAYDDEGRVYTVDAWADRKRPMEVAERIVATYRKYRPERANIETVAYQEMMRDYLRSHVDVHIPGLERKNNPRKSKTERIEGLQPEFAKRLVFLRAEHSALEEEFLMFPRGSHDDLVDAYYYARKGAYRPLHTLHTGPPIERSIHTRSHDWMIV
jgi:predicted phage terminase large subunit-like protein